MLFLSIYQAGIPHGARDGAANQSGKSAKRAGDLAVEDIDRHFVTVLHQRNQAALGRLGRDMAQVFQVHMPRHELGK